MLYMSRMAFLTWLPRLFAMLFIMHMGNALFAEEFYLDSARNTGTLRFEINNDFVWDDDSGFTNGRSFQYHTVRYDTWDKADTLGLVQWVGKHFPTLDDNDSIVRNSH